MSPLWSACMVEVLVNENVKFNLSIYIRFSTYSHAVVAFIIICNNTSI